jgi:hypothetical protein
MIFNIRGLPRDAKSLSVVTRRRAKSTTLKAAWNAFSKMREPCFKTSWSFFAGQRSL